VKKPFTAYSGSDPYVFVSYAHADADSVYAELTRLRQQDFRIWYDEGIGAGLTWRDEVALAIVECSVFLVFLTPRAVLSQACQQEINFAMSREIDILVVYLEDCELTPGMEMGLNNRQAINRQAYDEEAYSAKLQESLRVYLSGAEPATTTDLALDSSSQGIAILPLVNRSKDPEAEYLGDGIAEELITGMAGIDGLRVVSGFSFNSAQYDARNLGLKFKVDTILDGSIQKIGDRIRVNVRLTRTGNGETMWARKYDRTMADIFELQDTVAASILEALKVHTDRDHLMEFGTSDVQAYQSFLLGIFSMRKDSRDGYQSAVFHFRKAVELDTAFSRAWYQLGLCYWELTVFLGQQEELLVEARKAFESSREQGFSPEIPWVQVNRKLDPHSRPSQRRLAEEALEALDSGLDGWLNYEYAQLGRCLGAAGLYHDAFDYLSRYLDKVPPDQNEARKVRSEVLGLLPILGRFNEAIQQLNDHLANEPDDVAASLDRCMLYFRTGQYQKAEQQFELLESSHLRDFLRFYKLNWSGQQATARPLLERILENPAVQPRFKVRACAMVGDVERTVHYMDESVARGAPLFHIRMLMSSAISEQHAEYIESSKHFLDFLHRNGVEPGWPEELARLVESRRS